jgi:DNA-binding response OmpR family regulator
MSTRVLLIEDEPILVSLYTIVLSKAGYDVATALDAKTGEEKLLGDRPHVIVLDLLIPAVPGGTIEGEDFQEPMGFKILRFVKETPSLAEMRVMVLSNLDSDEHVHKAADLGADDYVVKADLDPHKLHSRVEKILHAPAKQRKVPVKQK